MCILFFAFGAEVKQSTGKSLVLLFNRDEGFDRDTAPLHQWQDYQDITVFGGRDMVRKGTWFAVSLSPRPRFAVLTNYRVGKDEAAAISGSRSRGEILTNFLQSDEDPLPFLMKLRENRKEYGCANIVVGSLGGDSENPTWKIGHFCLKFDEEPTIFTPGVHVIGNFPIANTKIKKIVRGTELFKEALNLPSDSEIKLQPPPQHFLPPDYNNNNILESRCFRLLSDYCKEDEEDNLPQTGCGNYIEHHLSSIFVPPAILPFTAPPSSLSSSSPPLPLWDDHKAPYEPGLYGTRSSAVFSVSAEGEGTFAEFSLGKSYKNWVKNEEKFSMKV